MSVLVSVIVPVYNVAPFLKSCFESVADQSYKNLEIILIDDGSTDGSGRLCDDFAAKDSRVVVVHQQNGGLSKARNVGLGKAHGEYVCFVDSDDVLHKDFVSVLLSLCLNNNVSLACCGFSRNEEVLLQDLSFVKLSDMDLLEDCSKVTEMLRIFSTEEAVLELCKDVVLKNYAWGKLYKKSLFEQAEIEFPVGRTYEDIYVTYKLFESAGSVLFVDLPLYFYRIREASISENKNLYGAFERTFAFESRIEDLKARNFCITGGRNNQVGTDPLCSSNLELEKILMRQVLHSFVLIGRCWKRAGKEEQNSCSKFLETSIERLLAFSDIAYTQGILNKIEKKQFKYIIIGREKSFFFIRVLNLVNKVLGLWKL